MTAKVRPDRRTAADEVVRFALREAAHSVRRYQPSEGERIPAERLWVNRRRIEDASLGEVVPALTNMVAAAKTLRSQAN